MRLMMLTILVVGALLLCAGAPSLAQGIAESATVATPVGERNIFETVLLGVGGFVLGALMIGVILALQGRLRSVPSAS
jgi:hypothetical protein